jgi:hypothetical protein
MLHLQDQRAHDSELSMSAQVAAVCHSGYYQLRQLSPVVRAVINAVKTLIHALFPAAWNIASNVLQHRPRADRTP